VGGLTHRFALVAQGEAAELRVLCELLAVAAQIKFESSS